MENVKNEIKLIFVRFNNYISKYKSKLIGFEIKKPKKEIFKIMLKSITDFTIPGSTSTLIYFSMNGYVYIK